MSGGIHYGEVEGLVSVERWSCLVSASVTAVLVALDTGGSGQD